MRAIEYGLQKYGDYSLKDSETNIFVFNDEIKVEPKEESNQNAIQDNSVFIELENQFTLKKNGDVLSQTEFEYIKNTELTSLEKTHSAIQFSYNEIPIIADIYKINNQNFVQIPIGIADPYIYAEEQILFGKNKKTKPAKPTLNTILKDKKMAVVLFVSTDGAQMERAYQSIDTLYENEIVLFIEKNKGVNTFGSVVRVKTGSNIASLGMFPYKDLSKIVKIYNTDIGSDSFEEILKEHLEDKTEKAFLVKDTFLGFFDKVVSFGTDLTLKAVQEVAEEFAKGFDQLKIDEKRWKYYKEDGAVTENPDLFLPGLSLIKEAQIKSNENNELSTSKINALAIAYIEELEILLKNKVKENQKGNEKESFTKEKAFKKIINLVLEALANAKKFLKNPLGKELEIAEEIFVTYNAFIVGLLNGLTQAVKGIFDLIALICKGLIALRDLEKKVAKNSITYMSLFFETLENQLEAFINLFSKENLTAIFEFFKKCLLFSLTMPTRILNWLTSDSKPITLDTIGYYFGYIIGTIIEMVLEILAFGGASTVVKAIEKLGKSFADLFKGILATFSKVAKKGKAFIVDNFIAIFAFIREKSKNLKPLLDDFFKFIESVFARAKDFLATFPKAVRETYQKFGIEIREVPKSPALFTGIPVKVSNDVYVLIKEGKEIFRGTKEEVEAIADTLKGMTDDVAKKYLDELTERIDFKVFLEYESKLKKLNFNKKLPKQIADISNNFKQYFVKVKEGKLITKEGLFNPTTHKDNWVDWIITETNELKFGHGHAFMSNNAKNIKNAGTALIENGKIYKITNWSGHYLPEEKYLDEILLFFEKMEILSKNYIRYNIKLKK